MLIFWRKNLLNTILNKDFDSFGAKPAGRILGKAAAGIGLGDAQKYPGLVNLHGFENTWSHTLSGCMKQRGIDRADTTKAETSLMEELSDQVISEIYK